MSIHLLLAGFPCWIGDRNWVVTHLPGQDLLGIYLESMNINELQSLQDSLKHGCDCVLDNLIDTSSECVCFPASGLVL